MYARLVRFSLQPGKESAARGLASELVPEIKKQAGCGGATVFVDGDGEGGLFVLWDTEDHANAAAGVIRPQLDKHFAGNIKGPPDARLFNVLSS
jgi:quinol monooxygenase YgiN